VEAASCALTVRLLLVREAGAPVVSNAGTARRELPDARLAQAAAGTPRGESFDARWQRLLRQGADDSRRVTVLLLEIPEIADVADLCGGDVAQMLRSNIDARINHCLRRGDVAGGVGDDEFAVIVHDVHDHEVMTVVIERITHALRQPFLVLGREFCLEGDISTQVHGMGGEGLGELSARLSRVKQPACAVQPGAARVSVQPCV
jgi:diguanylate cyclase (GGDEF)-like protein